MPKLGLNCWLRKPIYSFKEIKLADDPVKNKPFKRYHISIKYIKYLNITY